MEINDENYEAWFLDYFENRLGPGQVAELMVFLGANPELQRAFEGFEHISLSPDTQFAFPGKETLKRPESAATVIITPDNCEEFFISSVEKLLSPEEEQNLNEFLLNNPAFRRDLDLYRKTILTPDLSIQHNAKESLKHAAPFLVLRNRVLWPALAVAASAALLVSIYIIGDRAPENAGLADQQVIKQEQKAKATENAVQNTEDASTQLKGLPAGEGDVTRIVDLEHNASPKEHKKMYALNEEKAGGHETMPGSVERESSALAMIPTLQPRDLPRHAVSMPLPASETRYEFSELYEYTLLRNRIEYEDLLRQQQNLPLLAKARSYIRQVITGPDEFMPSGKVDEETRSLWALAELGVKGFNAITNSNVRLQRQQGEDGKTTSYFVKSDRIEYSKDLEKE